MRKNLFPYYAIDLANKIKAETLLVIAGPPDFDNGGIKAAEDIVLENLEKLSRYAEEKNIKLGLEVIHPMYIDTWSAVTTIDQAMNIIDKINSKNVGLFLDTYHIFWDPNLYESLERASGKIFGVHINDWKYPTTGFMERVVMGQGIIPIENIIKEIYNNGYRGYFEVEILSGEISSNDYKNIIKNAVDYYQKFLLK